MSTLKELHTPDELNEMMNYDNVIVYGAGKVTTVLLNYLYSETLLDNIFCIAVTERCENPDDMRGIPVCQIDDLLEYTESANVLISTLEGPQPGILLELKRHGFVHVFGMSNLLYAKLRKLEASYESDIMQKIVALERNQKTIVNMLHHIENIILHEKKTDGNNSELYLHMFGDELKEWYWKRTGKILNLDHPRSFNEKIQWLKLCDTTPLKTMLADKYKVRSYVCEKIGDQYLIPIYGVWNDFTEIDFTKLPNQFVLKCNHGSGWNYIVRDKSKIDYKKLCMRFNNWLNSDFSCRPGLELQYRDIQPRIIAEKYISEIDGEVYDYRFYCFNGNPLYVWVDSGSGTSDHKRTIFNIDWELQNYKVNYPNIRPCPSKPDNYAEMVECARKLSDGFIFVRVDLYSVNGKIYFGEMTFTPQSGAGDWEKDEIDMYYGSLMKLPIE